MFSKILVAVDKSENAHRVIDAAVDLADHYHAQLCLLHAFPHIADHLGSPVYDQRINATTLHGNELLETLNHEIEQAGKKVAVETQLIEGPPAAAILRVAEAEHFDLIVMGTRGNPALVNMVLGSVSSTVTHKASCPVMVIH